jgi:hypothetical protein
MKDTILLLMLIWSITTLIMRRRVFEENIPLWVTLLRLILSPLLLITEALEWIWIGIKSSLRN